MNQCINFGVNVANLKVIVWSFTLFRINYFGDVWIDLG